MSIRHRKMVTVDPVFAAIDFFREKAALVTSYPTSMDDPEFNRLMIERDEAMRLLASTRPTTKAGALAMMTEVFIDEAGGDMPDICKSPISRAIETLLSAWPGA